MHSINIQSVRSLARAACRTLIGGELNQEPPPDTLWTNKPKVGNKTPLALITIVMRKICI